MATIGRKTVSFENLEKPISDYCGGTGTMANFFKMLTKCKQDIIEQTGTDYSDETVLSLTDFISCVQSGVLCGRSDSFSFLIISFSFWASCPFCYYNITSRVKCQGLFLRIFNPHHVHPF